MAWPRTSQRTPRGSVICPWVSVASKSGPAASGPEHSRGSRVQSQMQAPTSLSGSAWAEFRACQPHDQTVPIRASRATCFTASASSFTCSNQAIAGNVPRFDAWKPSMSPTRRDGIPMSVNVLTASRNRFLSVRLPATVPWRWIRRPLK